MATPVVETYVDGNKLNDWYVDGQQIVCAYMDGVVVFSKTLEITLDCNPNKTSLNLQQIIIDKDPNGEYCDIRITLNPSGNNAGACHHPTIHSGNLSNLGVTLINNGSIEAGNQSSPALNLTSDLTLINNGYIRGYGGNGGRGGTGGGGSGGTTTEPVDLAYGYHGGYPWAANLPNHGDWEIRPPGDAISNDCTKTLAKWAVNIYKYDNGEFQKLNIAQVATEAEAKAITVSASRRYSIGPGQLSSKIYTVRRRSQQVDSVECGSLRRQHWAIAVDETVSTSGGGGGAGGAGGTGQYYKHAATSGASGTAGTPGSNPPSTQGGTGGTGGSGGVWGKAGNKGGTGLKGGSAGTNGTAGGPAVTGSSHLTTASRLNNGTWHVAGFVS